MKIHREPKSIRKGSTIAALCFLFVMGAMGDVVAQESDTLKFPIRDQKGGLFLDNQVKYDVQYDAIKRQYILYPQIGTSLVSEPIYLTRQEYLALVQNQDMKSYFRTKSQTNDQFYREQRFGDKEGKKESNILPSFRVKSKAFEMIFGGSEISLIPQGYANLDLGVFLQKIDNPMLLPQNRQTLTMDLNQRMQLSILGKVGENLQMKVNYDTQAGFGFENQMKLQWRKALGTKLDPFGGEDDILQNVELGNISMPLSTSLITGAQSLFGVRTDLKFGRTNVTAVFSEQRSEAKNIVVQGGGVMTDFKVAAEKYEYNRHFFLGQYFRNSYDRALSNYPAINSNIKISNIEVWKVDKSGGNQQNRRSVIAIRDIAESNAAPNNSNNGLFNDIKNQNFTKISDARNFLNGFSYNGQQFQDGENFVVNESVRKLDPSEFTFYPKLGYVSLNTPLVDGEDLLAVSFQYTLSSDPGKLYTVGQMSNETDKPIIAKLIKPNSAVNVASPMWDLMMKNIYSLNAYGVSNEDFMLNINFKDNSENSSGKLNYLPNTAVAGQPLLQVMNMDRLNTNEQVQQNPNGTFGDGLFDFQPGLTIDTERGNIIFTTVEPFGANLTKKLQGQNPEYVFNEIYDQLPNTLTGEKLANRYTIEGRYKGTVSDGIPLGAFNVPQGSVKVTSGGATLTEGVDYTVDYQLGRVKIINDQLKNSGAPINVSLENQSTFNLQKKRFMGINVEHKFSDKFMLGGTLINYQERPVTQKTQFGSEPVNNTIFGLNTQYNSEAEWLTRLTNKIPGIKTDEMSNITVQAEAAYLMPGVNKVTSGYSYIDDFEDAQSRISILDVGAWRFGSTPGKPAGLSGSYHPFFPNGNKNDDLSFNNGRKMLSWYSIDPRFYGLGGSSPLSDQQMSTHKSRRVKLKELFDQRDIMAGTNSYISTFDMTFYPQERGPYNVNPTATDTKNWASVMRPISVSNFKDSNVEYVEFWMMDPFADGDGGNGELLLHLGNVSEDVLKDGELMYENGMPHSSNNTQTVATNWGKTPQLNPILYAFDTEGAARKEQDLGFNGLTDQEEVNRYGFSSNNIVTGELDPANDNYLFFLDDRFKSSSIGNTVQDRYRFFRNPQGNNSTSNPLHASSLMPDTEDINGDFNLDQTENYNQYTLKINRQSLNDPENKFIVARKEVDGEFPDKSTHKVKWYQVRIPVDNFDLDIDGDGVEELNNPASISQAESVLTAARYMRLVMRGFDEQTTLRFGTFDLVRSEWRRYQKNIYPLIVNNQEGESQDQNIDDLEIGEVSIERNNGDRPPYKMPPGVYREQTQGTTGYQSQNEASMTLKAKFKPGSTSKAIFKNTNLDLRRYKKLQMFVSAQDLLDRTNSQVDNGTKLFIRLGSDYTDNYYEYEIPVKYTPQSASTESAIWPDENFIDLTTDLFTDAKKQRDLESFSTLQRYAFAFDQQNPNKAVYVKGRPTLGNVSSMMIGVRNTSGASNKEVLLWVNELRLSEIDNDGGYAAAANVQFNLGDFANVQLSGSTSSVGFGAIDQGPAGRNQDESLQYALNAEVKLDKFLPKKWGMEVPFNFTIQESFVDPKYNPLDNDIIFNEAPNKAELEKVVRTYTQFKSFSFNNVRKIRSTKNNNPVRFYDPSNFSVSMMYSDNYYRDIYTQYNVNQQLRASVNYNFGFKGKSYQPFKNWRSAQEKEESGKYLQFVREFNINPLPTRFAFRTEIARTYSERQYRDISQYLTGGSSSSSLIQPTYSNNFLFNWQYNLGFDLTKSLRLDLTSSTMTLNDGTTFQKADQSLIWQNLFTIGRPVQYDQQFQVNYKLPFKFFPYLSFMNVELGFTSNYNWMATPTAYRRFETDVVDANGNVTSRIADLGRGTAQNSNSLNLIGDFDFTKFYPEFKGYKRFDSILKGRREEIDSLNQVYTDLFAKKRNRNKKSQYKFKNKFTAKDYGWMVLSSLKRANFTYNQRHGAFIPGLLYEPGFFGVNGKNGPSLGFVYGTQFDIKRQLIERGLIVNDELMTDAYQLTKGSDFTATALIEPIPDLRIDLNAKRMKDRRIYHSGFNLDVENPYIDELSNLNISTVSLKTAFKNGDLIFNQFLDNTRVISNRLGRQRGSNQDGLGYYEGFNARSSDVILPAFLAAVEGKDANSSKLGYNRTIPVPNWRVAYTGLKSIPIVNKYFDNVEILSAYNSTYTASSIQSNPNYMLDTGVMNGGTVTGKDDNGNYYTKNLYGAVTMIESFSPLLGVDLTFRNSMQLRAQYNRDRMLSLSTTNYTYTEDYGSEYIVGFGYIFKDFKMKIRYQGNQKTIKGDLNIRGDFSLRDNQTTIRKIVYNFNDQKLPTSIYGDSQITGGQRIMSFKLTADYNVSKSLNVRFYWDQMMSKYKISTAFPISQIRAGFSATFTFGN